MGFMDSLFGKKSKSETEAVKGPGQVLKEAGLDPAGLKFKFGADGTVTIHGETADEATRNRIGEVVGGIATVTAVNNQLAIASPEPAPAPVPEPEPAAEPAAETATAESAPEPVAEAAAEDAGDSYTVQSGDTLWKIGENAYGSGAKYMAIFEANRDQLDNPDLIHPGQVLKIPPQGD